MKGKFVFREVCKVNRFDPQGFRGCFWGKSEALSIGKKLKCAIKTS